MLTTRGGPGQNPVQHSHKNRPLQSRISELSEKERGLSLIDDPRKSSKKTLWGMENTFAGCGGKRLGLQNRQRHFDSCLWMSVYELVHGCLFPHWVIYNFKGDDSMKAHFLAYSILSNTVKHKNPDEWEN